jgi:hypothetical protein
MHPHRIRECDGTAFFETVLQLDIPEPDADVVGHSRARCRRRVPVLPPASRSEGDSWAQRDEWGGEPGVSSWGGARWTDGSWSGHGDESGGDPDGSSWGGAWWTAEAWSDHGDESGGEPDGSAWGGAWWTSGSWSDRDESGGEPYGAWSSGGSSWGPQLAHAAHVVPPPVWVALPLDGSLPAIVVPPPSPAAWGRRTEVEHAVEPEARRRRVR